MSVTRVDPVMLQVVKNGLESVAEQMAVTIRRTAYSTIIREVLDYATALFDGEGRLIAQSTRIPSFVNAMGGSLRYVLRHSVPLEEWEEGDVYLVNDPYLGGSQHLPDLATFTPVFYRGDLVGIAGAIGHQVDIGGSAPGGYNLQATEIFQEGLRIPAVRLYHRGRLVPDIKKLISANIRLPDVTLGDIEAQVAAMQIGQRGMTELLDRYGLETVGACTEELLNYSERLMRQSIRKIPNGAYAFADRLDDDGLVDEPVNIRVMVTVEDEDVTVDFTGTDPQRRTPANGSPAMVLGIVNYVIMAAVAPDIPVNEGCFRPIRVITPEGTVVNARPPAPVVGRIAIMHRCCDTILGALAQALPGRIPAAYYGMSSIYCLAGISPEGATPWILFEVSVGGWGGRPSSDGLEACSAHIHNVANTPVEMIERIYPVRVESYSLRSDSGGPGMFRGGLGLIRELRLLEGEATLTVHNDRLKFAPWGLAGGGEGTRGSLLLNPGTAGERHLRGMQSGIRVRAGDVFSIRTQGGGGYGDPRRRDPAAVRRDVALGKVSPEAAQRLHGVSVSG